MAREIKIPTLANIGLEWGTPASREIQSSHFWQNRPEVAHPAASISRVNRTSLWELEGDEAGDGVAGVGDGALESEGEPGGGAELEVSRRDHGFAHVVNARIV
jgi:hypothetical protein